MSYRLKRAEAETIITRAADQRDWHVFTEDPAVIRQLTKKHGPGTPSGTYGQTWTLPRGCVSLRKPMNPPQEAVSDTPDPDEGSGAS